VTRIDNNYDYSGYRQPSRESAEMGYWLASAATALVYKALPSFSNPFLKQMPKEHANNHLYKDAFIKSIDLSGLKEKGLALISETNPATDIGKGMNACFIPSTKEIKLNLDKASISGFHELGHAMNSMKGGFGRILQKLRGPGMWFSGVMASLALLTRTKPKDEKRDIKDWLQDNCGKLAFIGMLPTVAEEALASYKGIKIAKQAGLAKHQIQNLKKFYGKAWLSYAGYALVAGVSAFLSGKIMDTFTRPKKVEDGLRG
jgi:hypothetical protein